jgi:type III restriction enzyme
MGLMLRDYQVRSLAVLESYFEQAATLGAKPAFVIQTERPYRSVPQLPELPYVCLRVPTGGGKTIMAAHTVGIAAKRWVQRDRVVCLWLVPSNAIREQTLRRLRTPGDPYRDALTSRFDGPVTVMDLAEALYSQRGTLDGETVVIVSTLAALRVTDTEGRKIYEPSGALEHHFDGLAPELLTGLERREDGRPVESLANVLRLRRPVIVMDEAHNARTPLSFETLARFAPSCVVEFTATPATKHAPEAGFFASNVLAHVSAAELKAEEMIKLPVKLWTHGTWTDAVADALAKQRALEAIAAKEQQATGERIRPIVLLQAQPSRADGTSITPEALKRALVEDHHVPAEQIAIETGTVRELKGVDIEDPTCPIRFVITVQALTEGWDCPTAYILCSITEQASARAVEQLLGRVLRLPRARRKQEDELNVAYAYVVSSSFATAAQGLRDALVEAGFETFEAETMIEPGPSAQPSLFYATPAAPVQRVVKEEPKPEVLAALEPAVREAVHFDPATMTVKVTAPLSEEAGERLAECFTTPEAKAAVRALSRDSRLGSAGAPSPSQHTPRTLVIPQLAVRVQGALELFEETHFLDTPWRLAEQDAVLTEAEFPLKVQGAQAGEVDVGAKGKIEISFRDAVANQLTLLEGEPGWTTASLATWLDARIPHPDLTQSDVRLFIYNALTALMERTGATVDQLAREKYRLRKALETKIAAHRGTQRGRAYQQALFEGGVAVEVVPEVALVMGDPTRYAPNWLYEGAYRFRKHLFPLVGELPDGGEEHDCAVFLDEHEMVTRWVRNISGRAASSFWLQTSTDRFYPDFVGELSDGRVFAVEYKGADRWSNDDSREKRAVGELWAAASGGRCVFIMPKGPDWGAIDAALRTVATVGA